MFNTKYVWNDIRSIVFELKSKNIIANKTRIILIRKQYTNTIIIKW